MPSQMPDISTLMGSLPEGTIPPKFAPLLQILQLMLTQDEDEPDPALDLEVERLRRRLREQGRRLSQARRTVKACRLQNRLLARAHGACECWGGDPECERCGGRGASGWHEPDHDLLRDLIGPLRDVVQPRSARPAQPPSTQSTHQPNEEITT